LPKILLEEPLFSNIFVTLAASANFFDGSKAFPIPFGAVVLACQAFFHLNLYINSTKDENLFGLQ